MALTCAAGTARAARHEAADSTDRRGWYAGIEGGVPFAVSSFSSFADGNVRAGWQAGMFAGYAFSRAVSLEAQASWGRAGTGARPCCTETGYWLGADGRQYYAPADGMDGWEYGSLKSRVATQSYGLQLNLNVLPWLGARPETRWSLDISPRAAAMGTKARLYDIPSGRMAASRPTRWHFAAGFRLQGSYEVDGRIRLGMYTGLTFLTGDGMDGIPRRAHSSNYLWESGVRLAVCFGKGKAKAAAPSCTPPIAPIRHGQKPGHAAERPATTVAGPPAQKPVRHKLEKKQATFPVIFFDFNSASVRPAERAKAEAIARTMASDTAMRVRLTGWCDRRGSVPVNQRVSLRRAEAVKRLLVSLGVEPGRIDVDGKGTDYGQPDADKARRVEAVNIEEVQP